MLSKAFSAAPKLPDIVFPKKIATEHNQKQFVETICPRIAE